jgi:hypothetical protein
MIKAILFKVCNGVYSPEKIPDPRLNDFIVAIGITSEYLDLFTGKKNRSTNNAERFF